jgi:hypothetical protein
MKTDRRYEAQRNRLIPQAVKVANDKWGAKPKLEAVDKWNFCFHKKMTELARGLK